MGSGIGGGLPREAKVFRPQYVYRWPRKSYWRCESHVDIDRTASGEDRRFVSAELAQKRCDELNAAPGAQEVSR